MPGGDKHISILFMKPVFLCLTYAVRVLWYCLSIPTCSCSLIVQYLLLYLLLLDLMFPTHHKCYASFYLCVSQSFISSRLIRPPQPLEAFFIRFFSLSFYNQFHVNILSVCICVCTKECFCNLVWHVRDCTIGQKDTLYKR